MGILPSGVSLTVGTQEWPEVEDLVTTTETPGGYRECRFSLPSKGQQISLDDRLVIYDSTHDRYPFVGRISSVHKTGICLDFVATRSTRLKCHEFSTQAGSPSHPSGIYAGKIYPAGTPMLTALTEALQLCEAVFQGTVNIVDPGLQFVKDSSNLAGYTPEQIWNYISGLTGGLATPLLWHIRGLAGEQVVYIDYQDIAARYRVSLLEDQIDETWDSEQIITEAATEYGNDQVFVRRLNHVQDAGRQLTHIKYVNGSAELVSLAQAQSLTDFYVNQLGIFRASNTTLNLVCDKDIVRVVPPVGSSDDWPLWLIESGHGIEIWNRPADLAPYNEDLKYIIGTEYDWKSGKLVLTCGVVAGTLGGTVNQIVDYNINRLFHGPYNGPPGGNHPLADSDLTPQVGGELDGSSPPATSYGVPSFKSAISPDDPNVPYKKQIDPDLVADEGLEANFNFIPNSLGFQGGIRVIPGLFNEYEMILGNSTGKIAGTCKVEVYRDAPTPEFLFRMEITTSSSITAPIYPPVTLGRKDFLLLKVTQSSSAVTWGAISLHAKKKYPGLRT